MPEEHLISVSEISTNFNSTISKSENAIQDLTQTILRELSHKHPDPVDISCLASNYGISKRTVYYVTNVMMGLGLIAKAGVGKISWCSSNIFDYINEKTSNEEENISLLRGKREELIKTIEREDALIQEMGMSDQIANDSYVIKQDILELKCIEQKVCFLIRTPEETYIDTSTDSTNYFFELKCIDDRAEAFFIEHDSTDL
ncbi:Transcription factor E2F6 [Cucumispora dikerogammari]|nr:Transcription factor E2F6 [Cucumispora dikerogammari]